ncbi:MAG: AraC family transcriptional regulator, partial [Clostridia bacterium]|nr:AraC family transcriptional regulator [Clostridia bacterium]
ETAYAVGYDNPLYFSRLFTKHVGMSPSEYMNKYAGN